MQGHPYAYMTIREAIDELWRAKAENLSSRRLCSFDIDEMNNTAQLELLNYEAAAIDILIEALEDTDDDTQDCIPIIDDVVYKAQQQSEFARNEEVRDIMRGLTAQLSSLYDLYC